MAIIGTTENFIRYLAEVKGLSSNTLESYGRDLRQFTYYLENIGVYDPAQGTAAIVLDYLTFLKDQGKATSSLSRHFAALKSYYGYLKSEKLLFDDPTSNIKGPKLEKKLPSILSVEEVERLLAVPVTATPVGQRDKAMLELLYSTGIRVSELISLTIDNIDLNSKHISCSGDRNRTIPLGETVSHWLNEYVKYGRVRLISAPDTDVVFVNHHGGQLTRQGFWKIVKKYANQVNINIEITPQTLRHSFAAHMIAKGTDLKLVKEILGHADISSTQMYAQILKAGASH